MCFTYDIIVTMCYLLHVLSLIMYYIRDNIFHIGLNCSNAKVQSLQRWMCISFWVTLD